MSQFLDKGTEIYAKV